VSSPPREPFRSDLRIKVQARPFQEPGEDQGAADEAVQGVDPRARAAPQAGPSVQARVRRALRCPYCRDSVGQLNGLVCGRRSCGAMYHEECWQECVSSYGGCAVFGCGCRESAGLTRVGFWVRLTRMFLAAWLFPPKMIEALRQDGAGVADVHQAIRERARRAHDYMWSTPSARDSGPLHTLLSASQLGVVALAFGLTFWLVFRFESWFMHNPEALVAMIAIPPVLAALGLFGASWFLALGLQWSKAVLAGEFAALARLEAGDDVSYLGRMGVRGWGKKKG
jgi:hypothetical protein